MKFTIDKRRLQDALSVTGKSIVRSTTIPILACYLFEVEGNSLNITAGSMDFFISQSLGITQVEGTINKAIPAVRLSNLIKELPNQDITFQFDGDQVQIIALSGKYTIPTEDGRDYPQMKVEESISFTTDFQSIAGGVSKCLFACGTDELRPSLSGVFTILKNSSITYVACDMHVLSTISLDIDTDQETEVILPSKVLSVIETAKSQNVKVSIGEKSAQFTLDDGTVFRTMLIDSRYPDYKSVIPVENDKHAVVNTSEMLGALKRVSQFSEGGLGMVKLAFSEAKCHISATNLTMNETAEEEVAIQYDGESMAIGVISKQVINCLSKIDKPEADLLFSSPNRAILIVDDPASIANKTDLMLVMPCILPN